MKLTFLGANHEVTGSCTLLEAAGQRYLIDCGMEQGKDIYENQPIPVAPGEIDGVLATHAHIDHTGLLPLLVRNGFRGKIYATKPTTELCDIMLRDSAHIQEFEAEWKNRKAKRAGDAPVEPMYTVQDAEAAMKLFIGVDYETKVELAPGLEIRFVDVGHLLGSSSIEIWVTENGTCDNQDAFRSRYIYEHLHAMLRSGLPFERYYHWCFCDNFEWLEGESARFGLINVDYATQTRTIKRSGEFYADMIRNDGVTDEAYNTYVRGEVYRVE